MQAAMEQDTQHKIEVLTKRRCSASKPPHQQFNWSNSMANHRHTFHVFRRMRKRHWPQQQIWKPAFMAHDTFGTRYKPNGGYAIIWELEKIDRQIQVLQSQIGVLQQQLRIIQTHCVPTEQHEQHEPPLSGVSIVSTPATVTEDAVIIDTDHQIPSVN